MNHDQLDPAIIEKAKVWLYGKTDEETKEKIRNMIDHDPAELTECFYKDLEFGTGGLRGIIGIGTNRMNRYTVGMATQGLANYLKKSFRDKKVISVAIAYDSRNFSPEFARISAEVLSGNNIKVYLFDKLRPTPELSYAIRVLECQAGIVITASHNPKEYNGYKVYWEDGGQLVNPHDKNVIDEVRQIKSFDQVVFDGKEQLIESIGEQIDKLYIQEIKKLSLSGEEIRKYHDISIVYTPIHGTGAYLVPDSLKAIGFSNIHTVREQMVIDGNFPTVHSPNPEEHAALKMALDKASKVDADLIMATDPDADRVGIAVKDNNGDFLLLNGNQTASILTYYILHKWHENNKITGNEYIVKTIVTSELLKEIASSYQIECFDVLTGFKYIAEIIRNFEGTRKFIAGGEESYGFLVGDHVRDKDAVISCCMVAEAAAWARSKGKTIFELLNDIYKKYGFYYEHLISVVKKGKAGAEAIEKMMHSFRTNPFTEIAGVPVIAIKDYEKRISFDLTGNSESAIDLPKSNVLQFYLSDGSKITVRPSGTEPKIKFYFGVRSSDAYNGDYYALTKSLQNRIDLMVNQMIPE